MEMRPAAVSISINVNHGLRKGLRRLLRQIVANAAGDDPVCILAGEFLTICCWVRSVRRPICIAFESNSGHGDGRKLSELLFEFVILRLALSQSDAKAIIVNHDGDVVRIVEGSRGAFECGIIEVPLG